LWLLQRRAAVAASAQDCDEGLHEWIVIAAEIELINCGIRLLLPGFAAEVEHVAFLKGIGYYKQSRLMGLERCFAFRLRGDGGSEKLLSYQHLADQEQFKPATAVHYDALGQHRGEQPAQHIALATAKFLNPVC
jgi:hypothetical protein